MRTSLITVAACVVLAAPAATAAAPAPVAKLVVIGFSGQKVDPRTPPDDLVRSGGTYESCEMARLAELYVYVRFSGMTPGRLSSVSWWLNGQRVFVDRFPWDLGRRGAAYFYVNARSGGTLPDGRYTVEVRSGGKLLARGTVTRVTTYC